MNLSVVVDPADDHVDALASVVPGEAESHVTRRFDLQLEGHVVLPGCPQNQEVVVQNGAVLPLDSLDHRRRRQQVCHQDQHQQRLPKTVAALSIHFTVLSLRCLTSIVRRLGYCLPPSSFYGESAFSWIEPRRLLHLQGQIHSGCLRIFLPHRFGGIRQRSLCFSWRAVWAWQMRAWVALKTARL